MSGKDQGNRIWGLKGFPESFEAFNMPALLEMQRRNMEAMSKAYSRLAGALNAAAGKQMEMVTKLSKLQPSNVSMTGGNTEEVIASQLKAGREAMESAISHLRELNDDARQCWYDVIEEFETVGKEIVANIEEQFKKPKASPDRPKAAPEMQSPKAAPKAAAE